jgi:hypothetical protein
MLLVLFEAQPKVAELPFQALEDSKEMRTGEQ